MLKIRVLTAESDHEILATEYRDSGDGYITAKNEHGEPVGIFWGRIKSITNLESGVVAYYRKR